MSLYRYVDSKQDLLELALDSVLGEMELPPEAADSGDAGGPGRLKAPARDYRRVPADHPWLAPLTAAYPNTGPHARAFDAALHRQLDATGSWTPPAWWAPRAPAPSWPSRSS
ncbi:TetR/AcrR family transcriptional regulator [Streptomyces sp. NPDC054945]